jgi:hypothetical protein
VSFCFFAFSSTADRPSKTHILCRFAFLLFWRISSFTLHVLLKSKKANQHSRCVVLLFCFFVADQATLTFCVVLLFCFFGYRASRAPEKQKSKSTLTLCRFAFLLFWISSFPLHVLLKSKKANQHSRCVVLLFCFFDRRPSKRQSTTVVTPYDKRRLSTQSAVSDA